MFAPKANRVFAQIEYDFKGLTSLSDERRQAIKKSEGQLMRALVEFDKCDTTLEQAIAWHGTAYPRLKRSQQLFTELSVRASDVALQEAGRWVQGELQALERSITSELYAVKLTKTSQYKLLRIPLIPLKQLRQSVKILDQRELDKFEISLIVDLPEATQEWLLRSDKNRQQLLIDFVLDRLAPLRNQLVRDAVEMEMEMMSEGHSVRKSRIRPRARDVEEAGREAARISKMAVRSWYRSAIRDIAIRDRFPIGASAKRHQGSVALDKKVNTALADFETGIRGYAGLVDKIYDNIAHKLGNDRNKLKRGLKQYTEVFNIAFEAITGETDSNVLADLLNTLTGTSVFDKVIGDMGDEALSFKRIMYQRQHKLDDMPGLIYQYSLKWRNIPETSKTAVLSKPVTRALKAIEVLEQTMVLISEELIEQYDILSDLVEDTIKWSKANEDEMADDLDRRRLKKLYARLSVFDAESWVKQHLRLDTAAKKLNEALAKLIGMLE
jgi:hypothetical protein